MPLSTTWCTDEACRRSQPPVERSVAHLGEGNPEPAPTVLKPGGVSTLTTPTPTALGSSSTTCASGFERTPITSTTTSPWGSPSSPTGTGGSSPPTEAPRATSTGRSSGPLGLRSSAGSSAPTSPAGPTSTSCASPAAELRGRRHRRPRTFPSAGVRVPEVAVAPSGPLAAQTRGTGAGRVGHRRCP